VVVSTGNWKTKEEEIVTLSPRFQPSPCFVEDEIGEKESNGPRKRRSFYEKFEERG